MTSGAALTAAYLLDWIAGDPEWLPHPVRLIGRATQAGEALLRRESQSAQKNLAVGTALTLGIVAFSYLATNEAMKRARRGGYLSGLMAEILLGWTCLASRNLVDESAAVMLALESEDLPLARKRLARIVGRDTKGLGKSEISRAVIETLAESACDGIVSPLFYLAIGGVPLAITYKAVNTLDSMIGHADERYFYFGKAAARLDDVANYFPSRLTALAIAAAAGMGKNTHAVSALRIWQRDGQKHKSPNAGQPESAMAGALMIRLGGENSYAGEPVATQLLGAEFSPPEIHHAKRALRLVITVSVLCAAAALGLVSLRKHLT